MLVVDASVLVVALADEGIQGEFARMRLRGHDLLAPELVDLEVASVLRKLLASGALDLRLALLALADLADLPMRRAPHRPLLPRCWELRANLTFYDAAYVALAEALGPVCSAQMSASRAHLGQDVPSSCFAMVRSGGGPSARTCGPVSCRQR